MGETEPQRGHVRGGLRRDLSSHKCQGLRQDLIRGLTFSRPPWGCSLFLLHMYLDPGPECSGSEELCSRSPLGVLGFWVLLPCGTSPRERLLSSGVAWAA